jgi:DNA recombination protein RmuC
MNGSLIALLAFGGIVVGAAIGYLVATVRAARRMTELASALAGAEARVAADVERTRAQTDLLAQSEARLRAAFDELAASSLHRNSELFLQLARETLGREQQVAQGALREREAAFAQLLEPIKAALTRTETEVQTLERERRDAFAALRAQIESVTSGAANLEREARNLVTALRRPEVRGRWGELTLRRVVELAGLADHADFTEQVHVEAGGGALRPDLIVHMPEERSLVVDVKTPLDAYLEAIEAPTEEARRSALARHAQQVDARVRELAGKAYWEQFARSPEYAVLFLPGDQFLAAALAERPDMLENALQRSVIIATPTTLIALLKAVAHGWRQAHVAANAAEIRDLGRELYRRLGNFSGHLGTLAKKLDGAVEAYNSAVGSLERQVLPQARRFPELGITSDEALPPLDPIERRAREPAATAAATATTSATEESAPQRLPQ